MNKSFQQLVVLIVEDHFAMRKIIRTVLHSIGIRHIVEAGDGSQALSELKARNQGLISDIAGGVGTARSIDLIIADWNMPNVTGIELLKQVRAHHNWSSVPFMMLTAENSREQIMEALNAGVSDYIVKPFTSTLFEAKVRSLIEAKLGVTS
ncbi:MAG: response regulator [Bdellovibrionota bacterium]